MRRYQFILIAAMAVTPACAIGQGIDPAARKEIDATSGKIVQAFKDGSARSLLNECTADFTWKQAGGVTLDRRKGEVPFRQALTAKHIVDLNLKIQKIAMAGPDATATVSAKETAELQDRDGRFGQKNGRVRLVTTGSIRETWAKTPQGWRLRSWEELPGAKVTSKPIQSQGPPR